MTLSDAELIALARDELKDPEYHVWALYTYGKVGRVLGSQMLNISESAWRHRLRKANLKMEKALEKRSAAA